MWHFNGNHHQLTDIKPLFLHLYSACCIWISHCLTSSCALATTHYPAIAAARQYASITGWPHWGSWYQTNTDVIADVWRILTMEELWKSLCACIALNFKPFFFFQSSTPPHSPSPTSHFMHCHFPLVSHGYFLLSSLFSACPFAVFPSLRHLPLISRRLSSLFFHLFTSIYIVYFLPMAFRFFSVLSGQYYMLSSTCGWVT